MRWSVRCLGLERSCPVEPLEASHHRVCLGSARLRWGESHGVGAQKTYPSIETPSTRLVRSLRGLRPGLDAPSYRAPENAAWSRPRGWGRQSGFRRGRAPGSQAVLGAGSGEGREGGWARSLGRGRVEGGRNRTTATRQGWSHPRSQSARRSQAHLRVPRAALTRFEGELSRMPGDGESGYGLRPLANAIGPPCVSRPPPPRLAVSPREHAAPAKVTVGAFRREIPPTTPTPARPRLRRPAP